MDSWRHISNSRSKAQICFFKILHIISSLPPSPPHPSTGGTTVDLNPQFCSAVPDDTKCDSSAIVAGKGENNEAIEADDDGDDGDGVNREESRIESEIGEKNERTEIGGAESEYNCLDLLIEAAKVISGKEESKIEEEESRSTEGKKERWMVLNLKSPVVRTKRGRSHALPFRFRDSVVEPLKRRRRRRPHAPSSTAASTKRHGLIRYDLDRRH